jgi:allantoate deiminase
MTDYPARSAQVIERCRQLARITDVPGETTRLFLSPATREAHALLTHWMQAAGLEVRTDAIGNLRGLLPGPAADSPRLLIGSHIDTVPNAGAFDGPLGVLLGLALIEELRSSDASFSFAIELIAFSEEEGVRFATPFLGSLALIAQLEPDTLQRKDDDGISLAASIRNFGLDPAELPATVADPAAAGYFEIHIEQGPVLEHEDRSLAVVEAIAGQTRLALTFSGHANHAGTTPMGPLRRDALAAASEWIAEVERSATSIPGLVATVGKVEVPGGAGNVIPGIVTSTLDVRDARDQVRRAAVEHLLESAAIVCAKRRVNVAHTRTLDQPAVPMDHRLTNLLAAAVTQMTGTPARRMPSGAGHDAMIVARRIPSTMLFLRSPGGLSHHPNETVLPADVEAALAAGTAFLRSLSL